MTPAVQTPAKAGLPWAKITWFGSLLIVIYAPVLWALIRQWDFDPDMGHGFFVPVIAGYIVWQQRRELAAMELSPNWLGLLVVIYGASQLVVATLGVELFLARTAFVISVIGTVLLLGGWQLLRKLAFPLFLLFLMVPIPSVIYNRITFPLQIIASRAAEAALSVLQIPVLREGNILELAQQRLSVVEACSGIRSLLSLTFLSLVYGHFFEKRNWIRVFLFCATIPIAIVANAGRVTLTGVLTDIGKSELAEGFFHAASGWVIFMIALMILIFVHQLTTRILNLIVRVRRPE
jgi:exosortase